MSRRTPARGSLSESEEKRGEGEYGLLRSSNHFFLSQDQDCHREFSLARLETNNRREDEDEEVDETERKAKAGSESEVKTEADKKGRKKKDTRKPKVAESQGEEKIERIAEKSDVPLGLPVDRFFTREEDNVGIGLGDGIQHPIRTKRARTWQLTKTLKRENTPPFSCSFSSSPPLFPYLSSQDLGRVHSRKASRKADTIISERSRREEQNESEAETAGEKTQNQSKSTKEEAEHSLSFGFGLNIMSTRRMGNTASNLTLSKSVKAGNALKTTHKRESTESGVHCHTFLSHSHPEFASSTASTKATECYENTPDLAQHYRVLAQVEEKADSYEMECHPTSVLGATKSELETVINQTNRSPRATGDLYHKHHAEETSYPSSKSNDSENSLKRYQSSIFSPMTLLSTTALTTLSTTSEESEKFRGSGGSVDSFLDALGIISPATDSLLCPPRVRMVDRSAFKARQEPEALPSCPPARNQGKEKLVPKMLERKAGEKFVLSQVSKDCPQTTPGKLCRIFYPVGQIKSKATENSQSLQTNPLFHSSLEEEEKRRTIANEAFSALERLYGLSEKSPDCTWRGKQTIVKEALDQTSTRLAIIKTKIEPKICDFYDPLSGWSIANFDFCREDRNNIEAMAAERPENCPNNTPIQNNGNGSPVLPEFSHQRQLERQRARQLAMQREIHPFPAVPSPSSSTLSSHSSGSEGKTPKSPSVLPPALSSLPLSPASSSSPTSLDSSTLLETCHICYEDLQLTLYHNSDTPNAGNDVMVNPSTRTPTTLAKKTKEAKWSKPSKSSRGKKNEHEKDFIGEARKSPLRGEDEKTTPLASPVEMEEREELRFYACEPDVAVCPCNHLYHRACLARWFLYSINCPVCRAPLPPIESESEGTSDSNSEIPSDSNSTSESGSGSGSESDSDSSSDSDTDSDDDSDANSESDSHSESDVDSTTVFDSDFSENENDNVEEHQSLELGRIVDEMKGADEICGIDGISNNSELDVMEDAQGSCSFASLVCHGNVRGTLTSAFLNPIATGKQGEDDEDDEADEGKKKGNIKNAEDKEKSVESIENRKSREEKDDQGRMETEQSLLFGLAARFHGPHIHLDSHDHLEDIEVEEAGFETRKKSDSPESSNVMTPDRTFISTPSRRTRRASRCRRGARASYVRTPRMSNIPHTPLTPRTPSSSTPRGRQRPSNPQVSRTFPARLAPSGIIFRTPRSITLTPSLLVQQSTPRNRRRVRRRRRERPSVREPMRLNATGDRSFEFQDDTAEDAAYARASEQLNYLH